MRGEEAESAREDECDTEESEPRGLERVEAASRLRWRRRRWLRGRPIWLGERVSQWVALASAHRREQRAEGAIRCLSGRREQASCTSVVYTRGECSAGKVS